MDCVVVSMVMFILCFAVARGGMVCGLWMSEGVLRCAALTTNSFAVCVVACLLA